MTTELKPCPFCGSAPVILPLNPEEEGDAWATVCCANHNCPAQPEVADGSLVADMRGSDGYKELAIARWNMRAPTPMILHCPKCRHQHIDAPEPGWDNPPHRSHLCKACGYVWRPADISTVGVGAITTKGKDDS